MRTVAVAVVFPITGWVPGIVDQCIGTPLTKQAGFNREAAQAEAVALIRRFSSVLNQDPQLTAPICC